MKNLFKLVAAAVLLSASGAWASPIEADFAGITGSNPYNITMGTGTIEATFAAASAADGGLVQVGSPGQNVFLLRGGDTLTVSPDFFYNELTFTIWDLDGFNGGESAEFSGDGFATLIVNGVNDLISNNVGSWVANAVTATIGGDGAISILSNAASNGGFYIAGISGDVGLARTSAVPLPAAAWLFLSVLGGAGAMRRFGAKAK